MEVMILSDLSNLTTWRGFEIPPSNATIFTATNNLNV